MKVRSLDQNPPSVGGVVFMVSLRPKLVDEFGVSGGEGNGVVARREIGGDIPNHGAVWCADESEEEVSAGRGGSGESGFARAVELGGSDVITVKARHDGTAVHRFTRRG